MYVRTKEGMKLMKDVTALLLKGRKEEAVKLLSDDGQPNPRKQIEYYIEFLIKQGKLRKT